ncbi:MAG: sulfite dehydrogenase, partial [Burkholderia sp.]
MPDPNASSTGALDSPERRGAMRRLAMTAAGAMTASLLPGVARAAGDGTAIPPAPATAPLEVAPWTREPGAPLLTPPYGLPSRHEADVIRRSARPAAMPGSGSSMTPL